MSGTSPHRAIFDGDSLEFDPKTQFVHLPGGQLYLDFAKSKSTRYYFAILHTLADLAKPESDVTSEEIKELHHRAELLITRLDIPPQDAPSAEAFRRLCGQMNGGVFSLRIKAPFEVCATEEQIPLPFRTRGPRYQQCFKQYDDLIRRHAYALMEEHITDEDYEDERSERLEQKVVGYRKTISSIFNDELDYLFKLFTVSIRKNHACLLLRAQGHSVRALPAINPNPHLITDKSAVPSSTSTGSTDECSNPDSTPITPPPPRDFVGREEDIEQLSADILNTSGRHAAAGVHGPPGIGKTTLARKVLERINERFDSVIQLDLLGTLPQPPTSSDLLPTLLSRIDPTLRPAPSLRDLQQQTRDVIANRKVLLLLDDAASGGQVEPLIACIQSPSACLFTSRQRFVLSVYGCIPRPLRGLPPEHARDLLVRIAPESDPHAMVIVKLCGYLPLAIRIAGSALAVHESLTPQLLIEQLENEATRLQRLDEYSDDTEATRSVESTIAASYRLLSDSDQRFFAMLGAFRKSIDPEAAAGVWQMNDVAEALDVLRRLYARSLVEWDAPNQSFRLHDLVRLYAQTQASARKA